MSTGVCKQFLRFQLKFFPPLLYPLSIFVLEDMGHLSDVRLPSRPRLRGKGSVTLDNWEFPFFFTPRKWTEVGGRSASESCEMISVFSFSAMLSNFNLMFPLLSLSWAVQI